MVIVDPAIPGAATIVIVALVAPDTGPRTHLTTPLVWEQVPCEETAETKLRPAGKTLVTVTPLATAGPLLLTVRL